MLDVWPALPLVVMGDLRGPDMDNIITVLERSDRVCRIALDYDSTSQVEKVWAAMQEPFPELRHLWMYSVNTVRGQVVPDSFLGGSAPRLRFLQLDAIPFPGLPKLLLSTTHLVALDLSSIPHSGYFSPEALVTALSRTATLDELSLAFRALQSRPDPKSRHSLPSTRTVLPALRCFKIEGACEYLEDFLARIDVPRLNRFSIALFYQFDIDTSQLVQFVSRTPTLKAHDEAHVAINGDIVDVTLLSRTDLVRLTVQILFEESDFQLSSPARVSTSSLPFLSMVKTLYIYDECDLLWEDEIRIENTEWLDLLRPYAAVENLYLSKKFGSRVVHALKGSVEGRTTVVLPKLQTVFLEGLHLSGHVQEDIRQFVAMRQLPGYPCAVSLWDGAGKRP